jgi:hypothetical protein
MEIQGSYTTFFFNSTEILPEGICDIPPNPLNGGGGERCFGETSESTYSFLLGPADAIAVVGCTPPPVRFFSFDVDISVRTTEEYPYYVGQPFGDTVSYRIINTTGLPEDPLNVFDEPMLLIHSADGASANMVANAYVSNGGIADSAVSLRQIDTETVRLWDRSGGQSWRESKPDILCMIGRMTMPDPDADNMENYQKYEQQVWPVKFYFAYDDTLAKDPFVPSIKPRDAESLSNETDIFTASMEALHTAVVTEYTLTRGLRYLYTQDVNFTSAGFYDDWDDIIEMKGNSSFILSTRDALYGSPISSDVRFVPPGTGGVAIGVIHRLTLGAAYNSVGVSVLDISTSAYIESHWFSDVEIEGSAMRYLPNDPNAKFMFAVDFMPPGMCNETKWCVEFNQTSYDTHTAKLILGERIYCLQDTMVGPPANKTVSVRLPLFMV